MQITRITKYPDIILIKSLSGGISTERVEEAGEEAAEDAEEEAEKETEEEDGEVEPEVEDGR